MGSRAVPHDPSARFAGTSPSYADGEGGKHAIA